MNAIEDEVLSTQDESFKEGKLYKYDGHTFIELPVNDDQEKLFVTHEAKTLVHEMRKQIHDEMKRLAEGKKLAEGNGSKKSDVKVRKPDVDVIASVLLMHGARGNLKDLAEAVNQFYRSAYS